MRTPEEWVAEVYRLGAGTNTHRENIAAVVAEAQAESREAERRRLFEMAAGDRPFSAVTADLRAALDEHMGKAGSGADAEVAPVWMLFQVIDWLDARLAHMAQDNGYRDGWDERVAYGPWTTLGELREGAVFETRNGVRAVKSEYRYGNDNPDCKCILLESGEYAHFPGRNAEPVREVVVKGVTG